MLDQLFKSHKDVNKNKQAINEKSKHDEWAKKKAQKAKKNKDSDAFSGKLFRNSIRDALGLGVLYVYNSEVEGDFVEFGSRSGRTARNIAQAMKSFESKNNLGKRTFHVLDSFIGFPDMQGTVDGESVHFKSGRWFEGGEKGLTKEQLEDLIADIIPRDCIKLYDGWYSETVPTIDSKSKFAFIHIDCDLYHSTMDALDRLFKEDMISEGATIFFDDWDCNRADPRQGERKAWKELTEKYQVEFSDLGWYGWGGHRFIIHSYKSTH
jgi:hypothetical protein